MGSHVFSLLFLSTNDYHLLRTNNYDVPNTRISRSLQQFCQIAIMIVIIDKKQWQRKSYITCPKTLSLSVTAGIPTKDQYGLKKHRLFSIPCCLIFSVFHVASAWNNHPVIPAFRLKHEALLKLVQPI